jgi:hypothetical protein
MCRRAIRGILNDGSDGGDVKPPVESVVRKPTQETGSYGASVTQRSCACG